MHLPEISHAYIIEGQTGVYHYANQYAKTLQCLQSTREACGTCISCRVFDSGNHPDTLYIQGSKPNSIGVDDVREQLISQMSSKPFRYKYKIFIIDKAETLTPSAQNALLKTIEEPAPFGVFLLLTSQLEAMLPTVVSRCVVVKYRAEQPEMLNKTDEAEETLLFDLITSAHEQDILGAMALYKRFEPYKENKESLQRVLDKLYTAYGRRLRSTGSAACARAIQAITQAKQILAQNGNFQLTIELMLLQIAGLYQTKEGNNTWLS